MSEMLHWSIALDKWDKKTNFTWDSLQLAALMAILQELKKLNATMQCPNTQRIPRYLARIAANTSKKRRKK